ncbi:MAG: hypothetical protein ACREX9_04115 [Gammaproteobacteria bacterium]
MRLIRAERPFQLDAMVVLPDHRHAVWTLPPNDADYSTRWACLSAMYPSACGIGSGNRKPHRGTDAWNLSGASHEIVVLDSVPYRLDKVLSDYKGRDPLIHNNTSDRRVTCLLDLYEVPNEPSPDGLRTAARLLRKTAREVAHRYRTDTVFRPASFRALVAAATQFAEDRGHIAP